MARILSFLFVLAVIPVWATTYTWIGGETGKWNERTSFNPDPGEEFAGNFAADDEVEILDNETVKISPADADSWAALNLLKRIRPMGQKAVLEITVDSGTAELKPAVTWSGMDSGYDRGLIHKLGEGELQLKSKTRYTSGKWDYYTNLKIEEGSIRLPSATSGDFFYGVIEVMENGTLYTASSLGSTVTTAFRGIRGSGLITNDNTSGGTQYLQPFYGSVRYEFAGKITGNISLYVRGWLDLTNTESTYTGANNFQDSNSGVYLGIAKFGNVGEPSSIGVNTTLYSRDYAGRLMYLGRGEQTARTITWSAGTNGGRYDNVLSGGLYGGLELSGGWWHREHTENWYMNHIVLAGTNSLGACSMSGSMSDVTVTSGGKTHINTFYVTKRDPGRWNLLGSRSFSGGIAVENGVLGFDSIAEAGKSSALGKATMLTASDAYGNYDDLPHVDYAYTLGSESSADCGMMDYMGAADVDVRTRSTVLKGKGGFSTDDARLRLSGVSAIAADTTLVLGGAGSKENQIANVTTSAGQTLSVEKRGSGSWTLSENLGVNGSIQVKGGKLTLRNSNRYRWFRWMITGKISNGEAHTAIDEFALFDEGGTRLNVNITVPADDLSATTNATYLAAGSADYGCAYSVSDDFSPSRSVLSRLFDDSTSGDAFEGFPRYGNGSKMKLNGTDDNALVFLVRVPDDAPTVAAWDWVPRYWQTENSGKERTPKTYHLDASVDGVNWVTVTTDDRSDLKGSRWAHGGEVYSSGEAASTLHKTGYPIPVGPEDSNFTQPSAFASVSVAENAELSFSGIAAPISRIELDCASGMGTLRGAKLATEGQLVLKNVPQTAVSTFEYRFENVDNAVAFYDWTVVDESGCPTKCDVEISDCSITIKRRPLYILFK